MKEMCFPAENRIQKLPVSLLPNLPVLRWRSFSALLIIVVVLGVMGYQNTQLERIQSGIDRKIDTWRNHEITSYVYRLETNTGGGVYSELIAVENGKTTPITMYLHKGRLAEYDSVEDLFQSVSSWASLCKGYFFRIEYDKDYGFPAYACFGDNRIMNESYFRITDFAVTKR